MLSKLTKIFFTRKKRHKKRAKQTQRLKSLKRRRKKRIRKRKMALTSRVNLTEVLSLKMALSTLWMKPTVIHTKLSKISMMVSKTRISIRLEKFLEKAFTKMKTLVRTKECLIIRLVATILFMSEKYC